jgi:hypothetical protein
MTGDELKKVIAESDGIPFFELPAPTAPKKRSGARAIDDDIDFEEREPAPKRLAIQKR